MFAPLKQQPQLSKHTNPSADIGGNGSTFNSQFRKRPQAVDENRIENYINSVRKPKDTHGNGSIAGPPENSVDHKQQQDHDIPAKHPLRKAIAMFERPGI